MLQSWVLRYQSIHTYGLLLRRLFIPLILDVREIYVYVSNLSVHVYSSVYSYSTRLRRLLRRSIPTALTPRTSILSFIGRCLLALPIIVSQFYRWAEIGDISPHGPYYKGSGKGVSASERTTCIIHRLFLPSAASLLRLSILTATFLSIWFFIFERFIIDWILFSFIKSLDIRVYHPCLFISVYPSSTRLRRLLRRSILTALTPQFILFSFIRRRLISLPIIVSQFYRWAEIAHITTFDSHYKGSGTSER